MRPDDDDVPDQFASARDALRVLVDGAAPRPELSFEDLPAPRNMAPFAAGVMAIVTDDGEERALGRLVVLHDPGGKEAWKGDTRMVAFVQADLDPEMAVDPLLGGVGWSWLIDALEGRDASYVAISGTVTRTVSESFGDKAGEAPSTEFELRASWTPDDEDPVRHVAAWCDLLGHVTGLPPIGTTLLRPKREPGDVR
jgi:hypothetical protein